MSFIDALSSMVGYWSYFVLAGCQVIYGGLLYFLLVSFDGLYIFKFIEHLFDPSEAFQMSSLN